MGRAASRPLLLLTCEHGGHRVPRRWAPLFAEHVHLLASHRGWDPGTLRLGRTLARRLNCPLIASTTTRLLVELNRSPHHRDLFSFITRPLPAEERQHILAAHYQPHRQQVEQCIAAAQRAGRRVVHVGLHSFTPVFDGIERQVEIGLLYDPRRHAERAVVSAMLPWLETWQVRRNQPYRGAADGLTTWLRRRFGDADYAGLELELNQKFVGGNGAFPAGLARAVGDALAALL